MQLQLFPRASAHLCIARNLLLVGLLVAHRLGTLDQPSLRIANQRFTLCFELRSLVANQDLVIPCLITITTVDANIPRSSASVLGFALPLNIRRCTLLVVEVSGERESETLVQALLVEEVCFLEAREVAGDEGCAGDDGRGQNAVGFLYVRSGGGSSLLCLC